MSDERDYDVIVVGAGPAGLSVGSELSKKLKVLVLDRKTKVEHSTKSWFVPTFVYDECPEVKQFGFAPGVRRFVCHTFGMPRKIWNAKLERGYWFVDEHALLKHFGEVIERNGKETGSRLLLNCTFENFKVSKESVTIHTSEGNFTGRLLVDASGYDSLVKKTYPDLKSDLYWWSVYGSLYKHPEPISQSTDMQVGDYLLWGTFADSTADPDATLEEGRPVMEYEILDEHTSFPMVLYLRKSQVDLRTMRTQFKNIMAKEDLARDFRDARVDEVKYGWYPSGGLSQGFAKDRVAFIGDSGVWSTPCGWGMAFILTNYKTYAANIADAVRWDRLDRRTLESFCRMAVHERHEILLDQIAAHFLSHASAKQIDRFIDFWDSPGMDFLLCEKLFTLAITSDDVNRTGHAFFREFSPVEMMKIFPAEDYHLLLREAKELAFDVIHEKVHRWKDRLRRFFHEDLEPVAGPDETPPLENGFKFLDPGHHDWDD